MNLQSARVFVSYSRKNKEFVEKLANRLQNRCIVWWDQRLTPAELWWITILEEIECCDCFVLILTPAYIASVFCLTELDYAQKLGKPILPVVPDRTVKFPPGVAHSQAAFIEGFSTAEAFGEIVAGLSGLRADQYIKPDGIVMRPPEPTPSGTSQISDLYADAAEAEAAGNLSLAERFYEQVIQVDAGDISKLATARLEALRRSRSCHTEYENIVRLATHPDTLSSAIELWHLYVKQCGTVYDPQGFSGDPRFTPPFDEDRSSAQRQIKDRLGDISKWLILGTLLLMLLGMGGILINQIVRQGNISASTKTPLAVADNFTPTSNLTSMSNLPTSISKSTDLPSSLSTASTVTLPQSPHSSATIAMPPPTVTFSATSLALSATKTPSSTNTSLPNTATATFTATSIPLGVTKTPSSTNTPLPNTATATARVTNSPEPPSKTPIPTVTSTDTLMPRSSTPPRVPLIGVLVYRCAYGKTDTNGNYDSSAYEICSVNIDGSKFERLTNNNNFDWMPALSPNGEQIAFVSNRTGAWDIYVMSSDGSNQKRVTRITNNTVGYPSWSPKGDKIIFSANHGIYSVNPDGTQLKVLTKAPIGYDNQAVMSPDGTKIIFASTRQGGEAPDLYIMNSDGSSVSRITTGLTCCWITLSPQAWSSDSARIIFGTFRNKNDKSAGTFVIDLNGSNLRRLTEDGLPAWNPVISPDGIYILFKTDQEMRLMNIDGTNQQTVDLNMGPTSWEMSWSR